MILGEIGEHCHVEIKARHALKRQGMGRDLHHHMGTALLRHTLEKLMQLQTLGRGVLGVEQGIADHVAVGADEAHLRPGHGLKHMLRDLGGAGLPAGAGKADELHSFHRIAEKVPAHNGKPVTAVLDPHTGSSVVRRFLAQNRRGAACDSLGNEAVSVGVEAPDGHKQIPRPRLSGIVADPADLQLGIGGAFQYIQMLCKLMQLHMHILRFLSISPADLPRCRSA